MVLEGGTNTASVLSARSVSHMFKETLWDTYDSLRFIQTIRREYNPMWRASMEKMGLLRFTREKHTCTEREQCLLSTMLRQSSGTVITAYTRRDLRVIDLTERSILRNLILPLYQPTTPCT